MRLLLAALLVVLGTRLSPLSFYQTEHWTGADAAYSVSLQSEGTLWLFGDTFTGPIVDGRRQNLDMIHNSFARTVDGHTTFYPCALAPAEPGSYYWPSDGVLWGNRLLLFEKKVRDVPGGPDGLSFDWWGDDLLVIDNPQGPPCAWKPQRLDAGPLHPGIACWLYQGSVYAYGLRGSEVVLARYDRDLKPLYFADGAWVEEPARATALFGQGASEMSVFPYRGEFLAVYTEGGLGPRIVGRTAPVPEGPWSEPVELYRAPQEPGLLTYAGKAHKSLSTPEKLVLSYCCNLGSLEAHRDRPDVYFPRFVEVKLR